MSTGKENYTKRCYFPMLVSETGTENKMAPEQVSALWGAFDGLSEERKNILTAEEMPEIMGRLQESLALNDAVIGGISLLVRKIFFGEISLPELEWRVNDMLVKVGGDTRQVRAVVEYIQSEILTLKPKPRVEEKLEEEQKSHVSVQAVKLPLLQALSKYENLGNQLITRERIRVKSQLEPVRPSLLYWIKYYRDELGIGHHDSVQRGDFLFRSENGKRLSPEEREHVNLVLKSVEENMPLEIDTERSEIIFPHFEAPRPVAPAREFAPLPPRDFPVPQAAFVPPMAPQRPPEANSALAFGGQAMTARPAAQSFTPAFTPAASPIPPEPGRISFSSNHVLPAEKSIVPPREEARPLPPPPTPPTPPAPAPPAPMPPRAPAHQANPFHIHPVSLGKSDEE